MQALHVTGVPAVPAIKKHHLLFAGAIKGVKQQLAQPTSNQNGANAHNHSSHSAHTSQLPPAPRQPKQFANVQVLLDNHEAAVNSLHTADANSPQPPCASLDKPANSSRALTCNDQDMVRRAEENCCTHQAQPSMHDSHRAYDSALAFRKSQARSTDMTKIPQSHPGAAASSLTADICSSRSLVTRIAAPPQLAHIDPVRPQESYSNTGQYQPLKDMAQSLRVSTQSFASVVYECYMHAESDEDHTKDEQPDDKSARQAWESIRVHNMICSLCARQIVKLFTGFLTAFHTVCCASTIVIPITPNWHHVQDNLHLHAGHAYLVQQCLYASTVH